MTIQFTKHGHARLRQRGFRTEDVELIRRCGTPLDDNEAEVYLLREQDAAAEIANLKHDIQRLERLRNSRVVISNDTLVTVYRVKA